MHNVSKVKFAKKSANIESLSLYFIFKDTEAQLLDVKCLFLVKMVGRCPLRRHQMSEQMFLLHNGVILKRHGNLLAPAFSCQGNTKCLRSFWSSCPSVREHM